MVKKLLERQAREFADDMSDLLNRTVTHGVRLSTAFRRNPPIVSVGVGVSKKQTTSTIFPLRIDGRPPTAYLRVGYRFEFDREEQFLTVAESTIAACADSDGRLELFHYDYDRVPTNEYPNPHVQVLGESAALDAISHRAPQAATALGDLHLPVGGRRFRPTLEDVIELLVTQNLAIPRPNWRDAVDEHRKTWEMTQLKAAVRNHPQWALEELTRLGHIDALAA